MTKSEFIDKVRGSLTPCRLHAGRRPSRGDWDGRPSLNLCGRWSNGSIGMSLYKPHCPHLGDITHVYEKIEVQRKKYQRWLDEAYKAIGGAK